MLIIGVDPGKEGALCMMRPGGITLVDMPTVKASKTGKRNYDLGAAKDILVHWQRQDAQLLMALETFNPMPKQSVQSIWSQSRGITIWEVFAVALGIPLVTYLPKVWKQSVIPADRKKDKDGAYWTACNLYPWVRARLKTPRGRLLDGRCDAICIAEHARRQQGGPFVPVAGPDEVEEELSGGEDINYHGIGHRGSFV